MGKKVGLLLLILWGLTFSTSLHIVGLIYRKMKRGYLFVIRFAEVAVNYRPLRHATSFMVFVLSFAAFGVA